MTDERLEQIKAGSAATQKEWVRMAETILWLRWELQEVLPNKCCYAIEEDKDTGL